MKYMLKFCIFKYEPFIKMSRTKNLNRKAIIKYIHTSISAIWYN